MTNAAKHGIDFEEAQAIWNDQNRVETGGAFHGDEQRSRVIGQIAGKCWTAVITRRGERIRLISVRRARDDEARFYLG
ncbi:BrnT family toxin [Polymorphobacter sp. PAMC 29334]|uniref:BrnT family toxin n=1 Tax=Polymorphobacter sp. PAMC 29334 TaxID=2862331 RepID=UPI002104D9AA|nr:BrnT family toxin [Polymorphobacter sp. PAMC 29334]